VHIIGPYCLQLVPFTKYTRYSAIGTDNTVRKCVYMYRQINCFIIQYILEITQVYQSTVSCFTNIVYVDTFWDDQCFCFWKFKTVLDWDNVPSLWKSVYDWAL